jgi:hypothetical protein
VRAPGASVSDEKEDTVGDSLPPPATIDLVGSFARRRGSDVQLVLWDPKSDTAAAATELELTSAGVTAYGKVTFVDDERGRRLECRVARSGVTDGQWSLMLRADGVPEPVAARLLVQGDRPLVLLWGAKAGASMVPSAAPTPKVRAARAGVEALDSALSVLPPQKAREVRGRIRRAGAKLLK